MFFSRKKRKQNKIARIVLEHQQMYGTYSMMCAAKKDTGIQPLDIEDWIVASILIRVASQIHLENYS